MFLVCSPPSVPIPGVGKSQFETRLNDFFFLSGGTGRVEVRTSGRGGGGGYDSCSKADEASSKDLARTGI